MTAIVAVGGRVKALPSTQLLEWIGVLWPALVAGPRALGGQVGAHGTRVGKVFHAPLRATHYFPAP